MSKISLVVITFNEEANIRRCIESALPVVDEVVVVDSLSTDDTVNIAASLGAKIILQPFLGYREQKAFALKQATHDRILALDADEELSPLLVTTILAIKNSWPADAYRINRLNHLGRVPVRHGGWYPDSKIRLFDRRIIHVGGRDPHDRFEVAKESPVLPLRGDLLHYTNRDIEDRIQTQNKFSSRAAVAYYQEGKRGSWIRLLIKPCFRFLKEYIWLGGFRDGLVGLVIARTSAAYVFWREAKLLALHRTPPHSKP